MTQFPTEPPAPHDPNTAYSMPQTTPVPVHERRAPNRPSDDEFIAAHARSGPSAALILGLVVALLVGIGAGIPIGFVLDKGEPTPAKPAAKATAPASKTKGEDAAAAPDGKFADETVSPENLDEFGANPRDWVGAKVDGVIGEVSSVSSGEGGWIVSMFVNGSLLVVTKVTDKPAEGTYLRVDGRVVDVQSFKGTLYPKIEATETKVVTALDARPPATRTAKVGDTVKWEGVEITIDKVEFADDETRVFASAKNGSGDRVTLLFPKLLANGTDELTYGSRGGIAYGEPASDLRPGAKTSGVWVYEAMDPKKDLRIELTPSFEDFDKGFLDEPLVVKVPGE